MYTNILSFEQDLRKLCPKGVVSLPHLIKFGHVSFNGLFFHKDKKEETVQYLKNLNFVEKFDLLPNGFLNIWFKENIRCDFETQNFGNKKKIHLEYCSPNPTGPLHIGHFRNIIIGSAIANLLQISGHDVFTEIYINDQGNQIKEFEETIFHHVSQDKDLYKVFYQGDYPKKIANYFKNVKDITKDKIIEKILQEVQKTFDNINIKFDSMVKESSLRSHMPKILDKLKKHVFVGPVENQKTQGNHLVLNIQKDHQAVLKRDGGDFTYFAFDVAYHDLKHQRGFSNQICVLAEDHISHIQKLKNTMKLIGDSNLQVIQYGMLFLKSKEQTLQMSKRSGQALQIEDILEQIPLNHIRWIILSYNNNKVININLDNLEQNIYVVKVQYYIHFLQDVTSQENQNSTDDLFRLYLYWPKIIEKCIENLEVKSLLGYGEMIIKHLDIYFQNSSTISPEKQFIFTALQKYLQIIFKVACNP